MIQDPLASLPVRSIIMLLSNVAQEFVIQDCSRCRDPLYDKGFLFSRSFQSCLLKLLKHSQSINLVVVDMKLVCVTLHEIFLSLEVVEDFLEPTFEVLPQGSKELSQH